MIKEFIFSRKRIAELERANLGLRKALTDQRRKLRFPTPTHVEQLENLRRAAERGKLMAHSFAGGSRFVDIFQHILDELERIKNDNSPQ